MGFLPLVVFLLLGLLPTANADVYQFVIQKQEEKAKNRWSLSDWLDTRDRMRMMDLWLALHSPSPYEFFLGGEYHFGELANGVGADSGSLKFAAYASIFGVEFEQRFRQSEWNAHVNLRIFGYHVQSTNITLLAGLRTKKDPVTFQNPYLGASITLYLTRYFGVETMYRHLLSSSSQTPGITESGNRYWLGAFLDFEFFRIYGRYFGDSASRSAGPASTQPSYTGWALGAKVFF